NIFGRVGDDDVDLESNEFSNDFRRTLQVSLSPAIFNLYRAVFDPTQFSQPLSKGCDPFARKRRRTGTQKPDERQFVPLLRARLKRPCSRATEKSDELAPPHSITSSAATSSACGTVRPSALAVLVLITRSYLVGCSTGTSAGFVPRKILSTKSAARRNRSAIFGP